MSSRLLLILLVLAFVKGSAQTTIVRFEFNSADLSSETREALDNLLASGNLKDLGIFGHTDQVGTEDYNLWLSIERARRVRDYLFSRGLNAGKVGIVRGYGTQRLISNGTDEMSRQLNRRVVLMNGYKPTAEDPAVSATHLAMRNPRTSGGSTQPAAPAASAPVQKPAPAQPTTISKEQPVVKQQKNEKLIEDIKDKNTKAGENIVLRNINFYSGSHEFLTTATQALEDLTDAMQKIPTLEIEIQGHVCCQDDVTDAMDNATGELSLSVNRARAVYDYLIQKGISKNRLSYKGLAHQFPLIKKEVTEEDRIANRRVEIKIIRK
jgi:outer membrane protein OmpA-like peptidoglycan-associated protein